MGRRVSPALVVVVGAIGAQGGSYGLAHDHCTLLPEQQECGGKHKTNKPTFSPGSPWQQTCSSRAPRTEDISPAQMYFTCTNE